MIRTIKVSHTFSSLKCFVVVFTDLLVEAKQFDLSFWHIHLMVKSNSEFLFVQRLSRVRRMTKKSGVLTQKEKTVCNCVAGAQF